MLLLTFLPLASHRASSLCLERWVKTAYGPTGLFRADLCQDCSRVRWRGADREGGATPFVRMRDVSMMPCAKQEEETPSGLDADAVAPLRRLFRPFAAKEYWMFVLGVIIVATVIGDRRHPRPVGLHLSASGPISAIFLLAIFIPCDRGASAPLPRSGQVRLVHPAGPDTDPRLGWPCWCSCASKARRARTGSGRTRRIQARPTPSPDWRGAQRPMRWPRQPARHRPPPSWRRGRHSHTLSACPAMPMAPGASTAISAGARLSASGVWLTGSQHSSAPAGRGIDVEVRRAGGGQHDAAEVVHDLDPAGPAHVAVVDQLARGARRRCPGSRSDSAGAVSPVGMNSSSTSSTPAAAKRTRGFGAAAEIGMQTEPGGHRLVRQVGRAPSASDSPSASSVTRCSARQAHGHAPVPIVVVDQQRLDAVVTLAVRRHGRCQLIPCSECVCGEVARHLVPCAHRSAKRPLADAVGVRHQREARRLQRVGRPSGHWPQHIEPRRSAG